METTYGCLLQLHDDIPIPLIFHCDIGQVVIFLSNWPKSLCSELTKNIQGLNLKVISCVRKYCCYFRGDFRSMYHLFIQLFNLARQTKKLKRVRISFILFFCIYQKYKKDFFSIFYFKGKKNQISRGTKTKKQVNFMFYLHRVSWAVCTRGDKHRYPRVNEQGRGSPGDEGWRKLPKFIR